MYKAKQQVLYIFLKNESKQTFPWTYTWYFAYMYNVYMNKEPRRLDSWKNRHICTMKSLKYNFNSYFTCMFGLIFFFSYFIQFLCVYVFSKFSEQHVLHQLILFPVRFNCTCSGQNNRFGDLLENVSNRL